MPSGYTDAVGKGEITEFPKFAAMCARAFGALVMHREEPATPDLPPEPERVGSYTLEAVTKAEDELAFWQDMSVVHAEGQQALERQTALKHREKYAAEKAAKRSRYEAMLAKVKAWTPPSSEHEGMKEFMLKQLTDSIDWDCNGNYSPAVPEWVPAERYLADKIEAARKELARCKERLAEEQARVDGRNRWINDLRKSLEAS